MGDFFNSSSNESCAKIEAFVVPKEPEQSGGDGFLKIKFKHAGWGVNASIRQQELRLADATEFSGISIRFKSPDEEKVGIRVRVVDSKNIHWVFGKGEDEIKKDERKKKIGHDHEYHSYSYCKSLSTNKNKWKTVYLPLNRGRWAHFKHDGPKEIKGDTKMSKFINLVVIEPGLVEENCELTHISPVTGYCHNGKEGIIDIDEIKFVNRDE